MTSGRGPTAPRMAGGAIANFFLGCQHPHFQRCKPSQIHRQIPIGAENYRRFFDLEFLNTFARLNSPLSTHSRGSYRKFVPGPFPRAKATI